MLRALGYIHAVGICHRDIKPQNLLLNTRTHDVKLCDFGSAKVLIKGEPNVAYICSRYYRAPELVFEATEYSTAIDIWSLGCVMAELLLGKPLFPGDSGVDQLIEIIKILGTPTKEQILAMNPNHTTFKFPQIKPHPWSKVFKNRAPNDAIDLVSKFLHYEPNLRLHPFESLAHPFFDELRDPNARLPNGKLLPNLFNFTDSELKMAEEKRMSQKLLPPEILKKLNTERASRHSMGGGGGNNNNMNSGGPTSLPSAFVSVSTPNSTPLVSGSLSGGGSISSGSVSTNTGPNLSSSTPPSSISSINPSTSASNSGVAKK